MATFSVDLYSNKVAVAEAAVSSIASILIAAGFDQSEITALLRSAADQIESGEAVDTHSSNDTINEDDHEYAKIDAKDALMFDYSQTSELTNLKRISKRTSTFDTRSESLDLEKSIKILEQAIPLAEQATKWLLEQGTLGGIIIEHCRDEWLEEADDESLDCEDEIIFLDQWDVCGDFQFDLVQNVSSAVACQGDKDTGIRLQNLISLHDVYFPQETVDCVSNNFAAINQFDGFMSYVMNFSAKGEQPQANLINNFGAIRAIDGGYHIAECWLDSLVSEGKAERYKKGNRWCINVL